MTEEDVDARRCGRRSTGGPSPGADGTASDAALVRQLRRGSSVAAGQLYSRHLGTVRFVIRDNVRNPDDVDDVAQEVFEKAFGRLDTLTRPDRFRSWLLQIARRTAIDARRTRSRRPTLVPIGDRLVVDAGPAPDLVAEVRDLARAISGGLADLSARDRQVLTMVVELGFGLDDVAAALDISYGNAKVVLHRARRRLRVSLAAHGPDLDAAAAG